jgi:hypothetical protein
MSSDLAADIALGNLAQISPDRDSLDRASAVPATTGQSLGQEGDGKTRQQRLVDQKAHLNPEEDSISSETGDSPPHQLDRLA